MKTSQIFCGVFFLRKSYQTMPLCQNCPICQSAKRAKCDRQTSQILTKRQSVATAIIGALVHKGCIFASLIHARAIPSSSWGSAPPVTTGSV